MKSGRNRINWFSTIFFVFLLVLIVMPFYIMLVGAFKPNVNLIKIPVDLVPFKDFTLANFNMVFEKSELLLWLRNSFLISISVSVLTAFIAVTAGYAFAKIEFPGKRFFFILVMATMMMPKQMLLIPNYLVAYNLHLQDTIHGVILTSIAPAFGVFLSRQFISSLPTALFDAAEIDGCSEPGKFFWIALPLSFPAVGTISIFAFFNVFNDYLWQIIMISSKGLKTLPIGLVFFAQKVKNNISAQLALSLLATVPLIIIFLLFQNFFVRGVTAGAVKG